MKKMKFFLILISLVAGSFNLSAQSLSLKAGANFNRTIRAADPDIPNLTVDDFSPKNGYQAGLTYKQPLYKSFFVDASLGYLNKGHEKRIPLTKELLNVINYNYLTFMPSVGYDLPFGFSLKVGLGIDYLLNTNGRSNINAFVLGTVDRTQYTLSTVLAYNYKRFGLEISHNNNVKTIHRFEDFGIKYENYHEWYAASLSFQIFKK